MKPKLEELKNYVKYQHKNSMKLAEIFDKFCISEESKEISHILYEQIHMLSNIYENAVILEKLFYSTLEIIEEE